MVRQSHQSPLRAHHLLVVHQILADANDTIVLIVACEVLS